MNFEETYIEVKITKKPPAGHWAEYCTGLIFKVVESGKDQLYTLLEDSENKDGPWRHLHHDLVEIVAYGAVMTVLSKANNN